MKQFSLAVPALVVIFSSLILGISTGVTRTMDTPLNDKVQAAYFSNWYVMDCPRVYVPVIDQPKGHLRR
jgi:hypothetical protein